MIFVTVGSELQFDRLVRVVDEWAGANGRTDVFAQIGETDWQPAHITWSKFLQPHEFARRFAEADIIIAHAGMGTILSAFQAEKPILVMPRLAALRETRNDHQVATARRLLELTKINVAFDEKALKDMLARLDGLKRPDKIGSHASSGLLTALHDFITNPK
jgi:UDP-N-acetylglucosamine transferase subunit ALG13